MLLDRHSNPDGQPDGLLPVDVQQPFVGVQGRTSMARLTQANLWGGNPSIIGVRSKAKIF